LVLDVGIDVDVVFDGDDDVNLDISLVDAATRLLATRSTGDRTPRVSSATCIERAVDRMI